MMKITLDLVDYAFTLKQLRRLYQELPQELRSQKTSLPASELILEATEYISYLKKNALEEIARPLQEEVEEAASYSHSVSASPLRPSLGDKVIPDEIRDRFQVQHPLFYESLRSLKSSEELKVFAQLLRAPPSSLPKSPCFTLDSPHHSRAHLIVFNSTRSYSGDKLLSYCTSPSCINPHHYAELPSEVFIRNLSRRVLDKKNHEGYTSFLRALLKHLSSEEVSTLSAGFAGDRKACFPVQARSFPSRGEMNYRHLKEFVQHLLFKTFRFHSVDGELSLISSAECLITNGNDREKILCLNPWHFKQANIPKENQQIIPHICQPRLVVNISHSKFKCCICWTEILTSDKEESATLPTVQIQSTKVIVPVPSVIKPKDKTIAQQPEPQTPPQAQQQPQAKSQPQANSQPQAKSKSLAKPHSPALRERSTRKRKIQAIFQCWKCLLKFPTNSELESHPCSSRQRDDDDDEFGEDYDDTPPSVEVKSEQQQVDEEECVPEKMPKENPSEEEEEDAALLSAIKEEVLDDYEAHFFDEKSPPASSSSENKWDDTVYTCMYCGFASLDPVVLRSHQGKCKELGPGPLPELASSAMTSEASGTKSSLDARCIKCNVPFANLKELKQHSSKTKCRSVQCGVCNKFYSCSKNHEQHTCEGLALQKRDGILFFHTQNASKSFVDCEVCGCTLPTRHVLSLHRSPNTCTCEKCNGSFYSVCRYLSHACLKGFFGENQKKKHASSRLIDIDKPHQCESCEKVFISYNTLVAHKNKAHRA